MPQERSTAQEYLDSRRISADVEKVYRKMLELAVAQRADLLKSSGVVRNFLIRRQKH